MFKQVAVLLCQFERCAFQVIAFDNSRDVFLKANDMEKVGLPTVASMKIMEPVDAFISARQVFLECR